MKLLHIAAFALFLLLMPFRSEAGGTFLVLTQARLGFAESSTKYWLGEPAGRLISQFGPAEKITDDNYDGLNAKHFSRDEYSRHYLAYTRTHHYVNDGVTLTEANDGTVKGIVFLVSGEGRRGIATARTDAGIAKGASLRQIQRSYGVPFKTRSDKSLDYERLEVFYKRGEQVLSFTFKDGVLESIGLFAKYLPYLTDE